MRSGSSLSRKMIRQHWYTRTWHDFLSHGLHKLLICPPDPINNLCSLALSTAMKFQSKIFRKWSFFNQNQQPLKSVEPFERNLRALFISQCPCNFFCFLDLRNAFNRFRLLSRDFRLYGFFFPGSACFSKFSSLASPRNLPSWEKYPLNNSADLYFFRWFSLISTESA